MSAKSFPIVGVGASAGGLESLERFFDAAGADSDMAFVVVQHLSPHFKSMMGQLLSRRTKLAVEEAQTGTRVEPGHVYLLPPGKQMMIVDEQLVLADKADGEFVLPIDCFLVSLARARGPRSAAVILSGTGSDGTAGAGQIKARGGFVLAESHRSAKFYGMPRSVIETGVIDAVLPPGEMPSALHHAFESGTLQVLPKEADDALSQLLSAISIRHDVDFGSYRRGTIARRVDRRAQTLGHELDAYIQLALSDSSELDTLAEDFLINVTGFFRDEECFVALTAELDRLVRELPPTEPLRIWSAGCATGQEAYSLAIAAVEAFERANREPKFKIFATDLSRTAIAKASEGIYDEDDLINVGSSRRDRFFRPHEGGVIVERWLRESIAFIRHDILHDAPFTNINLVACRNLLIYLERAAQEKALSFFHFGLNADGVLFLGASESVEVLPAAFEATNERARLFVKKPNVRFTPLLLNRQRNWRADVGLSGQPPQKGRVKDHAQRVQTAILEQLAPPTIVIDSRREIVEIAGGAQRFLSIKHGTMKATLLDLLDSNVSGSIAGALRVLDRDGEPIEVRNVEVGTESARETVTLRLQKLTLPDSESVTALSFLPIPDRVDDAGAVALQSLSNDEYLSELEEELERTRANLQSVVEEVEASNEELQATNEELISSNEELQSTNEELSSVNEELYTVNTEYQQSIARLREANADIYELVGNTDIATLFLDEKLAIRRFTKGLDKVIELRESDTGRPVSSFRHRLKWPDFYKTLERVRETGERVEHETQDLDGRDLLVRMHAYEPRVRPESSVAGGVVVTITDISALAKARADLRDRDRRLRQLTNALPVLIGYLDNEERIQFVNDAYVDRLARKREDILGHPFGQIVEAENYERVKPELDAATKGELRTFELHDAPSSNARVWQASFVPHSDDDGQVIGVYVVMTDISERHRAAQALEKARAAALSASKAKSQFLANVSHEIRTPMTAISGFAELLSREVSSARAKQHVRTIRRNGEHLLSIINDVLDLSRIEEGRLELAIEPFSPSDLVWEVYELFAARAEEKQLQLDVDLPATMISPLEGDPRRLRQVLFNLVSNALKFTEAGTVSISGRYVPSDERSGTLHFCVTDTGMGFSPEFSKDLFHPFHQLDGSGTRKFQGSGLGLAICARIIDQMNGSIEATGQVGEGASFTFEVPLRVCEGATSQPTSQPPAQGEDATNAIDLQGARVLVVEDNADVRKLIRSIFRAGHAQVSCAGDGAEALRVLGKQGYGAFDLVVMDLQMPNVDGLTAARQLREQGFGAPIIALTARALSSDRSDAAEAGFSDYLAKPIDADALMQMAQRHVRGNTEAPRVLVVEDDVDTAELLGVVLRSQGIDMAHETSVDDALTRARSFSPHVVLSDLNLDGARSGLELATALRKMERPPKLVAVSGAAEMKREAIDAGFDRFVLKPYDVDGLIALIREPSHV